MIPSVCTAMLPSFVSRLRLGFNGSRSLSGGVMASPQSLTGTQPALPTLASSPNRGRSHVPMRVPLLARLSFAHRALCNSGQARPSDRILYIGNLHPYTHSLAPFCVHVVDDR